MLTQLQTSILRKLHFSLFVYGILFLVALSCTQTKSEIRSSKASENSTVTIENTLDVVRRNQLIVISEHMLSDKFTKSAKSTFRVYQGETEIPSQVNLIGPDQGLVFVLPEIGANQSLSITIAQVPTSTIPDYPKLTQAELSHKVGGEFEGREYLGGHFQNVDSLHVPAEHTDHSWFIRYEGPGWESDLVAYRFYLDWRNGIDVFGKKVNSPVLQDIGQDGFDNYHEPADWGMDVLKVGETLGLGSIATFEEGKARRVDVTDSLYVQITANGPVYSSVYTRYSGWDLPHGKTTIHSDISIHSGTRVSRMDLESTSQIPNFATGLIKDSKAEVLKSGANLPFSYLATYGSQSLADDKLGIAVIYPTSQLTELTEDELSHILVFDSSSSKLSYYFLAAWEQEPNGIKSKEEFEKFLNEKLIELSNPLKVNFN